MNKLLAENRKLRAALKQVLDIDYEKPMPLDIAYYDVYILSSLDRFGRLKDMYRHDHDIFRVLETYHKKLTDLSFEFMCELTAARRISKPGKIIDMNQS